MVIAANTTMTYLLMGWDPAELGRAPFQVSHCGAVDTQIAGISCHIIPGLSAFVGGGHHSRNTGLSNVGAGGAHAAHRSGYQR